MYSNRENDVRVKYDIKSNTLFAEYTLANVYVYTYVHSVGKIMSPVSLTAKTDLDLHDIQMDTYTNGLRELSDSMYDIKSNKYYTLREVYEKGIELFYPLASQKIKNALSEKASQIKQDSNI